MILKNYHNKNIGGVNNGFSRQTIWETNEGGKNHDN